MQKPGCIWRAGADENDSKEVQHHSAFRLATPAPNGRLFRKEIKDVADLRGSKCGSRICRHRSLARLGVVPQQIPGAYLHRAERGTIDAAEWVGPYDDAKLGFQKLHLITITQAGGRRTHDPHSSTSTMDHASASLSSLVARLVAGE